jgi:hypothetical protein
VGWGSAQWFQLTQAISNPARAKARMIATSARIGFKVFMGYASGIGY